MEQVGWILFYVYPARFNTLFLIVALNFLLILVLSNRKIYFEGL